MKQHAMLFFAACACACIFGPRVTRARKERTLTFAQVKISCLAAWMNDHFACVPHYQHTHTGNMAHLPSLGLFHITLCR